jgi:RimJ/RimL family protein N-acetyltransferase
VNATPSNYPEEVDTERLHLRRLQAADRDQMATVWADPDVWQSLRPGEPRDPEAAAAETVERHRRHWDEYGFGLWVAIERSTGELAGWIGASHPTFVPELADEIEIGWTLRRSSWGRGLATEAARVAAEAATTELAPDRLVSLILPTNTRSIAVAERLGMHPSETVLHRDLGLDLRVYELSSSSSASPQSVSSR